MTKEEIIDKYASIERRESDPHFSQDLAYDFKYLTCDNAQKAMDEYAKQQAIAFMNWSLSSECDTYSCTDENQWTNIYTQESITTEQLYDQFIEQQNKP